LALQFLLGLFEQRTVKYAPFGDTGFLERLDDDVLFELLDARRNSSLAIAGRSCTTTTITFWSISIRTSLKKPVANRALDRLCSFFIVKRITYLDRQITENRSCLGTLNTLDADILDRKRFKCQRRQAQIGWQSGWTTGIFSSFSR
jgi:hypothetical protein